MSTRTKFIAAIVALFVVFAIAEYRMPRKFQWKPTFSHTDAQPFGCEVFDSILSTAMPNGYTVVQQTLRQLEKSGIVADSTGKTKAKAILIITNESNEDLVEMALRLASHGNTIIVATDILYQWEDTLGIDYNYIHTFSAEGFIQGNKVKTNLHWQGDSQWQVAVYNQLIERSMTIPDSVECEVLATYSEDIQEDLQSHVTAELPEEFDDDIAELPEEFDDDIAELPEEFDDDIAELPDGETAEKRVIAAAFPIGRGELVLVSTPLLLTNYSMLSGGSHRFAARLMGRAKHLPVIRTESYMAITAHSEQSPLYVLLQRPPLRWAIYLTMLTLLLFCCFSARRRQRPIPVITKPRNGNMEFTQLIGTLFYQQHDNPALLARKLTYTTDELRREAGIDFNDPPDDMKPLINEIREAAYGQTPLDDKQLKDYIDQLDNLIRSS